MATLVHRVFCALTLLQALAASSPLPSSDIPRYFQKSAFTRRQIPVAQIPQELGVELSPNSAFFLPSDPGFDEITHRYTTLAPPEIQIAIQPAEESDIATIIKYCNANSLDFIAVNRGHGLTATLGEFKGVQIDLKQLRTINIDPNGQSALFQGGVYANDLVPTLWNQGYVTATGSNDCVGLAGPALGGGHGRYEGQYGLISDNIIHLNVVLADGSTVGVNKTSYEDLFWAMQGAGHNFGIVTSMRLNIYPSSGPTWHYHNYVWAQDKLEAVFEALNEIQDNGQAPPKLGVSFGQFSINSSISETEAILWWTFGYDGPAAEGETILAPFNAIESITDYMGDVPYPELTHPQLTDLPTCSSGNWAISSVMTQTWNITAERQLYNLFNNTAAQYPELAQNARAYHEGYAVAAATQVDSDSTAYPHRDQYHIGFFSTIVPDDAPELLAPAETWARESWDLWNAGRPADQPPATYINYATGNGYESLESVYGYEPWRLERLRALKAKYDPANRFRFYSPIVSSPAGGYYPSNYTANNYTTHYGAASF